MRSQTMPRAMDALALVGPPFDAQADERWP